ncbi:MAG: nucleoside phosphorylase [Desulfobacterales bacterium]
MKNDDCAIVNPVKSKNSPELPPFGTMIGSLADLKSICNTLAINECHKRSLYNSNLYFTRQFSIAGPMIGAPYAVMILESLLAWGAKNILFYGWCGTISKTIEIGTILLPSGAYIDEGTSKHYGQAADEDFVMPSFNLTKLIRNKLSQKKIPFKETIVWTTDAIYRETPGKVNHYLAKNATAVEMELSALFTAGKFRQANVSGLLVVSDDLSGSSWHPGFRNPSFIAARKQVCETIQELCREI